MTFCLTLLPVLIELLVDRVYSVWLGLFGIWTSGFPELSLTPVWLNSQTFGYSKVTPKLTKILVIMPNQIKLSDYVVQA